MKEKTYFYRNKVPIEYSDYLWKCRKIDVYFYVFISIMLFVFYKLIHVDFNNVQFLYWISIVCAFEFIDNLRIDRYKSIWRYYDKKNEELTLIEFSTNESILSYTYTQDLNVKHIVSMIGKNDSYVYNDLLCTLTIKLEKGYFEIDGEKSNELVLRDSFDCSLKEIFRDFL